MRAAIFRLVLYLFNMSHVFKASFLKSSLRLVMGRLLDIWVFWLILEKSFQKGATRNKAQRKYCKILGESEEISVGLENFKKSRPKTREMKYISVFFYIFHFLKEKREKRLFDLALYKVQVFGLFKGHKAKKHYFRIMLGVGPKNLSPPFNFYGKY